MKKTLRNNMDILQKDIDIRHLSNFKTPAKARYFYEIFQEDQLGDIYNIICWAKQKGLPILFSSGGTNMLFAFDVYEGVFIKNSIIGWEYDSKSKFLVAYSAQSIWEIAEHLEYDCGQDIWHRFIGLPGSIAGAVYGNAGCFGLETENNFVSCRVLDLENGQKGTFLKSEMDFSYRNSRIKKEKRYFVISATFDLSQKIEKYHSDVDSIDFRQNKQPAGNSCGSFFKNPSKDQSAGFLIEDVGLKGYSIGGAYFSEKHANFLIHDGKGTYKDLLDLIELAKAKVKEKWNIELENEVQIITN